jgi:hypothetical protein
MACTVPVPIPTFMRDYGPKVIPVAMRQASIEQAQRYDYLHHVYGTKRRTVRLEI